jgi:HEAT repeat protein
MLADVSDVWLDLLGIARDRDVPSDVRRSALFWLGQEAAAAATVGLSEVATDRDEEQDIRNAAIFALSQRPADEGAPMLMEIARTAEEAETRRQAMFWLAQSEAPGILDFFEEILLGQSR